jgi:hypothetical protein
MQCVGYNCRTIRIEIDSEFEDSMKGRPLKIREGI